MKLIAIDPSLHSTGWAIFGISTMPYQAGLVRPRKEYRDEELITRCLDIGMQLVAIAKANYCTQAIIEFPVFYGEGDTNAGSIFKLCGCIGAIAGSLNQAGVVVSTVLVPEWKGQLPKDVVIRRLKAILGEQFCSDLGLQKDMWDAVGIGLHYKGVFK